jgi:hypothetical protein
MKKIPFVNLVRNHALPAHLKLSVLAAKKDLLLILEIVFAVISFQVIIVSPNVGKDLPKSLLLFNNVFRA